MQYFKTNFTEFEYFAVLAAVNFEISFCIRAINDRGACLFRKIEMTAHKIGMKMCFKNIFYASIPFFCQVNISLGITRGVINSQFAFVLILLSRLTKTTFI